MKKHPFIIIFGTFLFTAPALADDISPLTDIYACADIAESTSRLQCFDDKVAAARNAENSGEFKTITRQEAVEVQKDAFGFSMPSLPKFNLPNLRRDDDSQTVKTDDDGQISELSLAIISIRKDNLGKVIVTFENGQVWLQIDSDKVTVSKKRPPETAIIKRAALGSFLIRLDTGKAFRAKRIE